MSTVGEDQEKRFLNNMLIKQTFESRGPTQAVRCGCTFSTRSLSWGIDWGLCHTTVHCLHSTVLADVSVSVKAYIFFLSVSSSLLKLSLPPSLLRTSCRSLTRTASISHSRFQTLNTSMSRPLTYSPDAKSAMCRSLTRTVFISHVHSSDLEHALSI